MVLFKVGLFDVNSFRSGYRRSLKPVGIIEQVRDPPRECGLAVSERPGD